MGESEMQCGKNVPGAVLSHLSCPLLPLYLLACSTQEPQQVAARQCHRVQGVQKTIIFQSRNGV